MRQSHSDLSLIFLAASLRRANCPLPQSSPRLLCWTGALRDGWQTIIECARQHRNARTPASSIHIGAVALQPRDALERPGWLFEAVSPARRSNSSLTDQSFSAASGSVIKKRTPSGPRSLPGMADRRLGLRCAASTRILPGPGRYRNWQARRPCRVPRLPGISRIRPDLRRATMRSVGACVWL